MNKSKCKIVIHTNQHGNQHQPNHHKCLEQRHHFHGCCNTTAYNRNVCIGTGHLLWSFVSRHRPLHCIRCDPIGRPPGTIRVFARHARHQFYVYRSAPEARPHIPTKLVFYCRFSYGICSAISTNKNPMMQSTANICNRS